MRLGRKERFRKGRRELESDVYILKKQARRRGTAEQSIHDEGQRAELAGKIKNMEEIRRTCETEVIFLLWKETVKRGKREWNKEQ